MQKRTLSILVNFSLVLLVCLFSNCSLFEKDEEGVAIYNKTLYGKLTDKINGNTIANVSVYLMQARQFQDYRIMDSTKTNSNGEFKINFKYLESDVYYTKFITANYYTEGDNRVVDENIDTLNVSFYPVAYVNFKIKNIEPSATTDELGFNISTSYFEYWELLGKDVDTILKIRMPSIRPVQFVFGTKYGSKDSIFSKYYTAQPGEVFNEDITY